MKHFYWKWVFHWCPVMTVAIPLKKKDPLPKQQVGFVFFLFQHPVVCAIPNKVPLFPGAEFKARRPSFFLQEENAVMKRKERVMASQVARAQTKKKHVLVTNVCLFTQFLSYNIPTVSSSSIFFFLNRGWRHRNGLTGSGLHHQSAAHITHDFYHFRHDFSPFPLIHHRNVSGSSAHHFATWVRVSESIERVKVILFDKQWK